MDSSLAQYSRFTPHGEELLFSDIALENPWRYANRRQINGLSLFSKRFYNPNPHQHEWTENATGGSKNRGKAQLLKDWIY